MQKGEKVTREEPAEAPRTHRVGLCVRVKQALSGMTATDTEHTWARQRRPSGGSLPALTCKFMEGLGPLRSPGCQGAFGHSASGRMGNDWEEGMSG